MPKYLNLRSSLHNFVKVESESGVWACSKCGILGDRDGEGHTLIVGDDTPDEKIAKCDEAVIVFKPIKIEVVRGEGFAPYFENLTPGSVHETVETPEEHKTSTAPGVWVIGDGEPVKLLRGEYKRYRKPKGE